MINLLIDASEFVGNFNMDEKEGTVEAFTFE